MKSRNMLGIDNIALLCFSTIKLFISANNGAAITGTHIHGLFTEAFFEFGWPKKHGQREASTVGGLLWTLLLWIFIQILALSKGTSSLRDLIILQPSNTLNGTHVLVHRDLDVEENICTEQEMGWVTGCLGPCQLDVLSSGIWGNSIMCLCFFPFVS